MSMIDIQNPPGWIELGKTGENDFCTIEFDVSEWLTEHPNGVISILFERPDGVVYPVLINATESPACWTVSAGDLSAAGEGQVEVQITDDDIIGKSVAIRTRTYAALDMTNSIPEESRVDWLNTVLAAAQRAETAGAAAERFAQEAAAVTQPDLSGLAEVAISGDYNDLRNTPDIPQVINTLTETVTGKALDATQGKALAESIAALGSGDMHAGLYDSNSDGTVDTADSAAHAGDSDRLGGELPSHYLAASGDASAVAVNFSEAATRTEIAGGETLSTLFGKLKRFFSDLHTVAFTGSYDDLSEKPNSFTPAGHAETHASSGTDAVTPASIGAAAAAAAVPSGGTIGQVLSKVSGTDYDTTWVDATGGGVTSFNGRTGIVAPQSGDYTPAQIGAAPATHASAHATDGADAISPASIGAAAAEHASAHASDGTDPLNPAAIGAIPVVSSPVAGNLPALDANGNLTDSGKAPGGASGVATLDANGKVVAEQISSVRNSISGTYTLSLSDAGQTLLTRNTAATGDNYIINIPNESDVNFPLNTEIEIIRYYSGTVTINAMNGVYMYYVGGPTGTEQSITIGNRWGAVVLKKLFENYWIAIGDIA